MDKSAPSPFPRGHGAWGGGKSYSLGLFQGMALGRLLGWGPILPFALDECSLTPPTHIHIHTYSLNKQHHPLIPPHTQRDLVPGNLSWRYPESASRDHWGILMGIGKGEGQM